MDALPRQRPEIPRPWSHEAPEIEPTPLQRPLPIVVGGTAKPRTVAAAVRYAQEYNTPFASVDEARDRRARVDAAAREAGREPLVFSIMTGCVVGRDAGEVEQRVADWRRVSRSPDGRPPVCGTVDEVADQLRAYAQAGVERAMLQHLHHEDVEMVALLCDLAAVLA
jgi:alkanesulfonate monooxygenase SsuD/methylene tetrahydromethanopterin reductase-like flavin-dependent oxidoreductase (luciferase family)